jgi:hypothetical protein
MCGGHDEGIENECKSVFGGAPWPASFQPGPCLSGMDFLVAVSQIVAKDCKHENTE